MENYDRSEDPPFCADRRRFIVGTSALGSAAILGANAPAFAQAKPPLKIGMLNTFSKALAVAGQDHLNGMNLYFESIGGEILGRKIQLIREDDELNPQVGLQKLRKLVESDKCDIVVGVQGSNVAMAIVDYLRQSRQFFICSGAGGAALSYIKVPNFFRVSTSTRQTNYPMGDWFYDHVAKEAVLTATDYTGGRDTLNDFKRAFVKRGGKVIKEIYPPLGTSDFSPYLADINSINPASTYSFFSGTDAVRFVKQYAELGLKAKIKTACAGFMVENDVLPAQGRDALGILNSQHYADTLDTPENKKFVADYFAKYKGYPSVFSEYSFVAARYIHEMLKITNGDTANHEAMRAAMLKVKFNAPRGPVYIDPTTQNIVHNIYIREVAEVDGRITNKVLATIKNIGDPPTRES